MANLPPLKTEYSNPSSIGSLPSSRGPISAGSNQLSPGNPLSPRGFNLGFLENSRFFQKTNKDGQLPKRRGPKPDSKPATTKRQQLNRQAQRTHRERKEMHMKELEVRVSDMKKLITQMDAAHKQTQTELILSREENRNLKEILRANNIQYNNGQPPPLPADGYGAQMLDITYRGHTPRPDYAHHHSSSLEENANTIYPPPVYVPSPGVDAFPNPSPGVLGSQMNSTQLGIDFVLDLERPCRDHIPIVKKFTIPEEGPPTGHELMLSAPPTDYFVEHPDEHYNVCKWDVHPRELERMMALSQRLHEEFKLVTSLKPPLAWRMIMDHPRANEFSRDDLALLKQILAPKAVCYGFGATIENWQVNEAIQEVLVRKTPGNHLSPVPAFDFDNIKQEDLNYIA